MEDFGLARRELVDDAARTLAGKSTSDLLLLSGGRSGTFLLGGGLVPVHLLADFTPDVVERLGDLLVGEPHALGEGDHGGQDDVGRDNPEGERKRPQDDQLGDGLGSRHEAHCVVESVESVCVIN